MHFHESSLIRALRGTVLSIMHFLLSNDTLTSQDVYIGFDNISNTLSRQTLADHLRADHLKTSL